MSLSEANRRILNTLREDVSAFMVGALDLDQIQASLQSTMGLLENDGTGIAKVVRLVEADVEEIRFTRLVDEQRSAIILLLDELIGAMPGGGTGSGNGAGDIQCGDELTW